MTVGLGEKQDSLHTEVGAQGSFSRSVDTGM